MREPIALEDLRGDGVLVNKRLERLTEVQLRNDLSGSVVVARRVEVDREVGELPAEVLVHVEVRQPGILSRYHQRVGRGLRFVRQRQVTDSQPPAQKGVVF